MRRKIDVVSGRHAPRSRTLRIMASFPYKAALELVDIRLLDHIVTACDSAVSFAKCGHIRNVELSSRLASPPELSYPGTPHLRTNYRPTDESRRRID
jgi:hypothetical protein